MLIALAAALLQSSAAELPTYDQLGLEWRRMPSLRHMQRLYGRNVAGRLWRSVDLGRQSVDLACTPDNRGRLDCTVINTQELEPRWIAAGEQLMERASVRAVDGGSPEGRTFGYTLRFGNWPGRALPDRYQPTEAGLRWIRRPEMSELWNMLGQPMGSTYAASFRCTTQADGHLDCDLNALDGGASDNFARAAAEAMRRARVRSTDASPVADRVFDWTVAILRQSGCGGGGGSREDTSISRAIEGGEGALGAATAVTGAPRCQPVMLTVNQPAAGPRSED